MEQVYLGTGSTSSLIIDLVDAVLDYILQNYASRDSWWFSWTRMPW